MTHVELPVLDEPALHGLAGTVVEKIAGETEAHPVALLVTFLACLGSIVDRGAYVTVGQTRHHANLWMALVGRSARARKGTSWDMNAPIFEYAAPTWYSECVRAGLGSGEALIHVLRDDAEPPADRRLFIQEHELAKVLKVAARDGSTLSPVLRLAWDGRPLENITKAAQSKATRGHISAVAHITVDELRRLLTDTETSNGFGNRWMWFLVDRQHLLPEGGCVTEDVYVELADATATAAGKAVDLGCVHRSAEGKKRWAEVYDELGAADHGGMLDAVTARAEAQVLRLSLVYAIADGASAIGPDHISAAYALWRYAEDSARIIWGDSLGDPVADKLLAGLRAAGAEGLSLTQQSDLFGRHLSKDDLERARLLLLDREFIEWFAVPGPGRHEVRHRIFSAKEGKDAK